MRRHLNDNPLVQAMAIGALALVVGFLLLTRVFAGSSSEAPAASTDPAATTAPAPVDSTAAPAVSGSVEATAPAVDAGVAPVPGTPVGDFTAGPGLPATVVDAYEDGKVVVLLIVRETGIDDRRMKATVERLRARGDTAVFVTPAARIARYSRITQGVDVQRVPALVVLKPKRLSEDGVPVASVSYGFRGPKSVDQTVRDALYKGPADLPYHPE